MTQRRRPRSYEPPILPLYREWDAADDAYLAAIDEVSHGTRNRYTATIDDKADPRVAAAQLRLTRAWNAWQSALRLMGDPVN